jgi:medium-chain acyl-[acyl-carrier-protein] hydrolase
MSDTRASGAPRSNAGASADGPGNASRVVQNPAPALGAPLPDDAWCVTLRRVAAPRLRLFCFPFAGGGPYVFLPWVERLPTDIEICAIHLPGRESRLREAPLTSMPAVVNALAAALRSRFAGPFAFAGHSMGALVAYELTRHLRRTSGPLPRRLIVSGRRAPHVPVTLRMRHLLNDAAFTIELQRLGGMPPAILADPELRALLFPLLRADIGVCDSHVHVDEAPLDLPITALGGEADPEVCITDVERWGELTTAGFTFRRFPGAHFFIQTHVEPVLALIGSELMAT